MPFWNNLPFFYGPATHNSVTLTGDLVQQNNIGTSYIGPKYICDYPNGHSYVLDSNLFLGWPVALVYWLPWQNNTITSVTWQQLNASGCQFFLTSEFSGCRFIIDSYGLAHIAHWQAIGPMSFNSSAARDYNETTLGPTPTLRRKLSFTGDTNTLGSPNSLAMTYGWYGSNSRAIVCGYKNLYTNSWHFKVLRYQAGNVAGGFWTDM
jgi:hypothetical protein